MHPEQLLCENAGIWRARQMPAFSQVIIMGL